MKVFWSWQSDSPGEVNRTFVRKALDLAVAQVSNDLGLAEAERPEVDHDTKGEPGLVDIVATIFKKIDNASAFVGDVTPIATQDKKMMPNSNVLIELGYALKSLGPERIILVANAAFGGRPEDLPFDLRHRRGPITYNLPTGASAQDREKALNGLFKELAGALTANLAGVLAKADAEATFSLTPAREDDASTWLSPGAVITHHGEFPGSSDKEWPVAERARAYMRISPLRWGQAKPSRAAVQNTPQKDRLWAYGPWQNGHGGANDRGVVAVALSPSGDAAQGATQWFDKTGEVWGFTTAITDTKSTGDQRTYLGQVRVLKDWETFLNQTFKFLEHHGALGPFRVEAGVGNLKGTHWSGPTHEATSALEPHVQWIRIARTWGTAERLTFLTNAYCLLCDAFNRPRPSELEVQKTLLIASP